VFFSPDRAGLTGPDGPPHHGLFDLGYMRLFPNMLCMAPLYLGEVDIMFNAALQHDHPSSIRYPKASALDLERIPEPIQIGKSETIREGSDGTIVAFGAMLEQALAAAELLAGELDICVINARFVKPIDAEMVHRSLSDGRFVITLEEGAKMGGFGSAFLESAVEQNLDTRLVKVLALPDEFIQHGDRADLLDMHGLSPQAIAKTARKAVPSQVR
ncbi:MAG: transketolase C-terminal domain-containing protein, partial [Rubripirellula sp.]